MPNEPGPDNDLPPAIRARVMATFSSGFDIRNLINGHANLSLNVPGYQFGRNLVSGTNPVMTELINGQLKQNPQNQSHSEHVEFVMLDFTQPIIPQELLDRTLEQYPGILKASHSPGRGFSDKHPGKIFVVIGAETVPRSSSLNYLMSIVTKAPTIFITNSQIESNIRHPKYIEAAGESNAVTFNLE